MDGVGIIIIFILIVLIYFLPSIVGYNKTNINSVMIINIFLGWTFLGWVIALAMAAGGKREEQFTPISYNQDPLYTGEDESDSEIVKMLLKN